LADFHIFTARTEVVLSETERVPLLFSQSAPSLQLSYFVLK